MKLKYFVCVIFVSLIMFTSFGETANVVGKHFENEYYPVSVDFAPTGDKVFYITAVLIPAISTCRTSPRIHCLIMNG